MIVRIGKHEVELEPHPIDASILVGDIDGFRVNVDAHGHVREATISEVADEDGHVIARVARHRVCDAVAEAMSLAANRLDKLAEAARREHERLDVHALNVAARMRETAEAAERARRLVDG